jgi:AhpC/TSA family
VGSVILETSVDGVASHKLFAEEHSLPFTLLAASTKETARAYGVLRSALGIMEIAARETSSSIRRAGSQNTMRPSTPRATPRPCWRI